MMEYFGGGMGFGFAPAWGIGLFALIIWSVFWKGCALWQSARRGESIWFIVLMVLNTAGILEIIYLFLVSKAGLPFGKKPTSTNTTQTS